MRHRARLELLCLEERVVPAGSIAAVNPYYGPMEGGTVVTISGTGFTGVTTVDFGATPATNVTVVNATTITATTPADLISQSESVLWVSVTLYDGAAQVANANDAYAYEFALTPTQVRSAYGVSSIQFPGGITGNGAGQTIAIIAEGNDPHYADTGTPQFATSDLGLFDALNGIPDPPSFQVVPETAIGDSTLPTQEGEDAEFSCDVEWSHSMAPDAKIIVVEWSFDTGTNDTLAGAIETAKEDGASVISMSFGGPEDAGELSTDFGENDTVFAANSGITYVVSSGDTGAPSNYAAYSPDVVAIGGTQLSINNDGTYQSETAWTNPSPANVAILDQSTFVPASPSAYDGWSSITGNFSTTGTWTTESGDGYGNQYLSAAAGSGATASWTFSNVPIGIPLELAFSWPAAGGGASSASYDIYDGGTLIGTVTDNQSKGPIDDTGTAYGSDLFEAQLPFSYTQSSSGTITVTLVESASSQNGPVFANAVALDDYQNYGGSGGGISEFESAPPYQQNLVIHNGSTVISNDGMRTSPDVSMNASTSVIAVVDGSATTFGGTSLAAPCWAGLIAIADQGLVLKGKAVLDSTVTGGYATQTALYGLPSTDFNDITTGYNGYTAGPGYDLVTGLGTPVANLLIPDLAGDPAELLYSAPDNVADHDIVVKEVGSDIDVFDNGVLVTAHPVATTSQIDISGDDATGTISLTVDYSGGDFTIPINYDAGTGAGSHTLTIQGGSPGFTNEVDTVTGAHAGTITLDSETITYSSVDSPIIDTTPATNYSVNGTGSANETFAIANDPNGTENGFASDQITGSDFPTIDFANKTNVTVAAAAVLTGAGPSTFTLDITAAAAGLTSLALDGGSSGATAFNVKATAAAFGTTLLDDGSTTDTAVIGSLAPASSGGTLAGIDGNVTVQGSHGGTTGLTIDDSGDSAGYSSAQLSTTINGGETLAELSGFGAQGTIAWDIKDLSGANDLSSVTIFGSSGGNTIELDNADAPGAAYLLILNSGNGNDTIDVAPQPLGSNLTVNGQDPIPPALGNTLIYAGDGTNNPTGVGTGTITEAGDATVTYINIGTIQLGPSITSINPSAGPIAGGTSVTITGLDFSGASAVTFGGVPATSFTAVSNTEIMATAPAHAAGTVDIAVTALGLTSPSSAADKFTYLPPPSVSSVSPTIITTVGGTLVTVNGSNFTGVSSVTFGGTAALSFTVVSDTQITATAPAHAAGSADIVVTATGGVSTTSSSDQVTYVAPPSVTSVSPAIGSTNGGTIVTILGSSFLGTTSVLFGTTPATSFTINSATKITATAPAGSVGTVNVTITNAVATSATSSSDDFSYAAPVATTLSFVSQPNSATAGTILSPVTVQLLDQFGADLSGVSVTVGISSGSLTTGGAPVATNAQGQAVFSNLSETLAGTYTLSASVAGLAAIHSSTFVISPAAPANISYVTQPGNATAGSFISRVTIGVTDQYGNNVPGVAVSIAIAPGTLTSGGGTQTTSSLGQVVFGSLIETVAGTYSLLASVSGLSSAASNPFTISPSTAVKLAYLSEPGTTQAGSTITPITVQVTDQYGNSVPGTVVGIAISPGHLTSGTTPLTSGSNGQVVFSDLTETVAGSYSLTASVTGLTPIVSGSFVITPAYSTAQFTFLDQPSGTTVGSPLYPVTVRIVDEYGNSLAGTDISMSISSGTLATGAGPIAANTAGEAIFSDLTDTVAGTYTLTGTIAGGASASSNAFVLTPAAASVLTFLNQPSSTTAGGSVGSITVQVADKYGNAVPGGVVSLALSSGKLSTGTTSAFTSANGQAVFGNLTENTAGTYSLLAYTSGSATFSSNSFTISPQESSAKLAFSSQPNNVLAGSVFSPITVKVADSLGNPLSGIAVSIGLSGSLTGTTTMTTNSLGQAVFSTLAETTAGSYTLTASAPGLASVNSNSFSVSALAASTLSFVSEPASTSAGSALGPVSVQVADKYGNAVSGTTVSIGLTSGALSSGTISMVTGSTGVAVFGNLTENIVGTYTLKASASGLSGIVSSSFVISAGAVSKLAFVSQPASTTAGKVLNAIAVQANDKFGNLAAGAVVGIGLTSGSLTSGTTPLTAGTNGQVVFSDLVEDTAGTYVLSASAAGINNIASSSFTVSAGAAATIAFLSQPNNTSAGSILSPVTVQVADAFGNPKSGAVVQVSIPSGTLSGTTSVATGTTGLAVFSTLSTNLIGTWSLSASTTGVSAAASNAFVVTAASASKLAFVNQPVAVQAGNVFSAVTVQVVDAFGNGIPGVAVNIALSPGTLSTGTTPVTTNAAGDAVFGDLSENTIGTYSLIASSSGLANVNSNKFTVTSSATTGTLSFLAQPSSAVAGAVLSPLEVQVVDQFGNAAVGVSVTAALSSGVLGGGTTIVTNSLGQATFSNLTVATSGAYTITVTAGTSNLTTNVFAITSTTDLMTFTGQPSDTSAGAALGPVTVGLTDSFGNALPGVAVSIALPGGMLSGTSTATTNAAGQAVFSTLAVAGAGTYSLIASAKGVTSVASQSFAITASDAAALSFQSQPTTTAAGNTLNPVTVKVLDAFGDPAGGILVSMNVANGSLTGTTTVASNASGLAIFSNLTTTTAGTYTLAASVAGLSSVATSSSFVVTGATPVSYSFITQPASTTAGTTFAPLTLKVLDQYDNGVAGVPVSLYISSGTLTGTTIVSTNSSGQAIFSNLSVTKAGTYTITASAGTLGKQTSSTFIISPGAAFLAFASQPNTTNTSSLLSPITVSMVDKYGNAEPNMLVSIRSSSGGLSGTTTATTNASGQAIFNTLSMPTAGTYSLIASASGLTSVSSSRFTVTTANSRLAFTTGPATSNAGAVLSQVVVQLYNANGTPLDQANVAVTIAITTAGGLSGTVTVLTNSAGKAIFSNLIIAKSGTYTMTATATVNGQSISAASSAFSVF